MCKIPCEQVFDEIFDGKIKEMKTGKIKIWNMKCWTEEGEVI